MSDGTLIKKGQASGYLHAMSDRILRELENQFEWPSRGQVNGITPEQAERLRRRIQCEGYEVEINTMEPGTFVFSVQRPARHKNVPIRTSDITEMEDNHSANWSNFCDRLDSSGPLYDWLCKVVPFALLRQSIATLRNNFVARTTLDEPLSRRVPVEYADLHHEQLRELYGFEGRTPNVFEIYHGSELLQTGYPDAVVLPPQANDLRNRELYRSTLFFETRRWIEHHRNAIHRVALDWACESVIFDRPLMPWLIDLLAWSLPECSHFHQWLHREATDLPKSWSDLWPAWDHAQLPRGGACTYAHRKVANFWVAHPEIFRSLLCRWLKEREKDRNQEQEEALVEGAEEVLFDD